MTNDPTLSAHTPGPWHVDYLSPYRRICIKPHPGRIVCDIEGTDEEAETNARLIAAAPRMFEALGKVLELCQVHNPNTGFYKKVDPYELHKAVFDAYLATLPKPGDPGYDFSSPTV
jgi:hypothetical protein